MAAFICLDRTRVDRNNCWSSISSSIIISSISGSSGGGGGRSSRSSGVSSGE